MDTQVDERMDAARAQRCAAWLARLAQWAGDRRNYAAALACESVRGIEDVTSPEWAAGVAWAGREPNLSDWTLALEAYGPVATETQRAEMAARAFHAALKGDNRAVRLAVTGAGVVR